MNDKKYYGGWWIEWEQIEGGYYRFYYSPSSPTFEGSWQASLYLHKSYFEDVREGIKVIEALIEDIHQEQRLAAARVVEKYINSQRSISEANEFVPRILKEGIEFDF